MKMILKQPLQILQIVSLIISQTILQTISWCFRSNKLVFIISNSFSMGLLISVIVLKLFRMYRSNSFQYLKESQLSFVIPYALMVSELYFYYWGFKTDSYYEDQRRKSQYWVYAGLILLHFAYSIVCLPELCSKIQYFSYIFTMAYQLFLLAYETTVTIGLEKVSSIGQLEFDVLLQQEKDIKICFLALFIGSTLIIMDYLNRTQEHAQKKKKMAQEIQMARRTRQLEILN